MPIVYTYSGFDFSYLVSENFNDTPKSWVEVDRRRPIPRDIGLMVVVGVQGEPARSLHLHVLPFVPSHFYGIFAYFAYFTNIHVKSLEKSEYTELYL